MNNKYVNNDIYTNSNNFLMNISLTILTLLLAKIIVLE